MTVALLAGSSCGHRVLSQVPVVEPLSTITVTNNLSVPVNVMVSSILLGPSPLNISFSGSLPRLLSITVTISPGQTVSIPLNSVFGLLESTYTITFTVGGRVYTIVPTLEPIGPILPLVLGDLAGVRITLSACVYLQAPGLLVTVTVGDEPSTSICLPPSNPSPSPPPPSPPPPSPSPPTLSPASSPPPPPPASYRLVMHM